MPRAIDMHVHLPTASFLQGAIEPFVGPAEKFFRTKVPVRKMEEVAQHYAEWDIVGVLPPGTLKPLPDCLHSPMTKWPMS